MMFTSFVTLAVTIAALGAGLMAGVYFAFSGFIMCSFDRLGATQAADAMIAINEVILKSWFMHVFFGSTGLYAVLSVIAVLDADLPGRWLLCATGVLYVAGMFLCTIMVNVPLNNQLAGSADDENAKARTWAHYREHWTRWNHLRSVCSLTTLALSIHYLINYS